ncbi:MAG: DUF2723 domain-containing protein [Labilithrix sp.]|nr:DUF2723 domain-containing protein [Labilithrix sp.]
MTKSQRASERLERIAEQAVVAAAAIAYVATAARTVQGGDSGELAAIGSAGGVAHPPGYPLYILWLRATAWLPATSPTHRTALATAVLGTLAIAMLQRACRAWGACRISSALASAMVASSPLMWRLSTETEVFALNALVALALVALASPGPPPRGSEPLRILGLGLLAGLGIANHHTIVLLAPLGVTAAVQSVRRAPARLHAAVSGVAALLVGLLPYGYLVYVTRVTPLARGCVWGDASTPRGLLHHFLRADYGTASLAVSDRPPEPIGQLVLLGKTLLESGIGILLVAGLAVAAAALVRRRPWPRGLAGLVASFVLAGPLFVTRFNLAPRGLHELVVVRFHLFPLVLAAVVGSLAVTRILDRLRERGRVVVMGLIPFAMVMRGFWSYDIVAAGHRPTTEQWLRNVTTFLPERAILVVQGDDMMGALLYGQCALGLRADIDVLSPRLLLTESYARRASARIGFELERGVMTPTSDTPTLHSAKLVAQLLASGRPVFIGDWFARGLEESAPSYPVGPLIRVVASWKDVPPPDRLLELNARLYETMDLESPPPFADSWAGARFKDYARPWHVLANAFERTGEKQTADRCRHRANALTPRKRQDAH